VTDDALRACPHCGGVRFYELRDVTLIVSYSEYGGIRPRGIGDYGSSLYLPSCAECGMTVDKSRLILPGEKSDVPQPNRRRDDVIVARTVDGKLLAARTEDGDEGESLVVVDVYEHDDAETPESSLRFEPDQGREFMRMVAHELPD